MALFWAYGGWYRFHEESVRYTEYIAQRVHHLLGWRPSVRLKLLNELPSGAHESADFF
jgi:hypothetical protein